MEYEVPSETSRAERGVYYRFDPVLQRELLRLVAVEEADGLDVE